MYFYRKSGGGEGICLAQRCALCYYLKVEVNILTMKYIITILLALVVLPAVAFGGVVWNQNNVTNTYEQRIVEIDAQIEELTTHEAELNLTYPEGRDYGYNPVVAQQFVVKMQIQDEVARLQEEKRILEVAYWLINNSFENEQINNR